VPPGFATTAPAYRDFIEANRLDDVVAAALADLEAGGAHWRKRAR
jgi:pyruvate,water dikinase